MGARQSNESNGNGKGTWRTNRQTISWSGGPADSMRDAIGRITDSGAAVLFSRTSDGGALVFQVFAGTERSKEYVTVPGDIVPLLAWAVETYS